MADEPGFKLYGQFYPVPGSYRAAEMALVKHVCDMPFREWARAVNSSDADDPLLLAGIVAVAAWRANPTWTRNQAFEYGDSIVPDDIELVGFDDEEDDADPPTEGNTATSSSKSPSSNGSPDAKPEPSIPPSSGHPAADVPSLT